MRRGGWLRRLARGYTVTELLMSLSVLALGVSGVIAMQRVTVASNRHAKNLAIATRIGEAWEDQLAADASTWVLDGNGNSTRGSTEWLKLADPAKVVDWFIPDHSTSRAFGPAFGPLGNPIDPGALPQLAHFCTHLRLAFLHSETAPVAGNGVIRAQIRVFWLREDAAEDPPVTEKLCALDNADFDNYLPSLHVVYFTTAVRQTPKGLLP